MKRGITVRLFYFLLGAIIFSSIGVVAYSITSKDVSFTPDDENWNVSNVEEAINSLYEVKENPFGEEYKLYFTLNAYNYALKDYDLKIMKQYFKYMTLKTDEGGGDYTRFWISIDGDAHYGGVKDLNTTIYTYDISNKTKIDWLRGDSSLDYANIELTFHN